MAQYWLMRIGAVVVPRIPLALARPLFTFIGLCAWLFAASARQRAERNLRHIPSLAANTARLHAAVRGVFITSALNYLDFLRGRHLTDAEIHAGWTIEGEELLYEAADEGRGVVIMGAHLGNLEFAASRLAHRFRMIAPVERMQPERLFALFCALRNHHNLHIVPADSRDALREMLDWLKGGGVLIIVADRHILGAGERVDFFGEPAAFATAPMALALRSGAPIICAFSWRTGPGRAHGVFSRLTWADQDDGAPAAGGGRARTRGADETRRALRAYVAQIERIIAAHPESWVSALAPVWEADPHPIATPSAAGRSAADSSSVDLRGTSVRGIDSARATSIK
jgi:lauroyl/myristoyl acyltransferase